MLERGHVLVTALLELQPAVTPIELAWLLRDLGREAELLPTLASAPPTPWLEAARAIAQGDLAHSVDLVACIGAASVEAYARLRAAEELARLGRDSEAKELLAPARAFYSKVGATRYLARANELLPGLSDTRVVRAPAETLPFADASFDVVVSTLVLCTVSDQAGAHLPHKHSARAPEREPSPFAFVATDARSCRDVGRRRRVFDLGARLCVGLEGEGGERADQREQRAHADRGPEAVAASRVPRPGREAAAVSRMPPGPRSSRTPHRSFSARCPAHGGCERG
jgi:hypothetical protein